jgi:transcriptional regulator with XRE-family HTH domain
MSADAHQSHIQVINSMPSYTGDEGPIGRPARASGPFDALAGQESPRSLGAVIAHRRRELGWSQAELAARMVAHGDATFRQSDGSRLENGKIGLPQRERLNHLAAVLDLPVGQLLARAGWAGADSAFPTEEPRPRRGNSTSVTESVTDPLLPPMALLGAGSPPMDAVPPLDRYGQVLAEYLHDPGEQALYDASLMS